MAFIAAPPLLVAFEVYAVGFRRSHATIETKHRSGQRGRRPMRCAVERVGGESMNSRARRLVAVAIAAWLFALWFQGHAAERPLVAGPNAAVSAGHPLTSAAALEILMRGGNAFDAGVAALLVGGVVEQDLYSLGGEALVLVYPQSERKVTSIV